jgi:hypothetical protein
MKIKQARRWAVLQQREAEKKFWVNRSIGCKFTAHACRHTHTAWRFHKLSLFVNEGQWVEEVTVTVSCEYSDVNCRVTEWTRRGFSLTAWVIAFSRSLHRLCDRRFSRLFSTSKERVFFVICHAFVPFACFDGRGTCCAVQMILLLTCLHVPRYNELLLAVLICAA